MIKELKERYDGKTIDEIEAEAKNTSAIQESNHREFIGALFYLENTKRYKENKSYRDASFTEYIYGFYGISFQTYSRYRLVYFRYPVESGKFGPGTIMKIVSGCGAEMVPRVVKEIEKEKKTKPERVREIIESFAKPRLKKRKARPTYKELERELIAEKKKNAEAQKTIVAQAEQIERLKSTVRRYESGLSKLMPNPVTTEVIKRLGV